MNNRSKDKNNIMLVSSATILLMLNIFSSMLNYCYQVMVSKVLSIEAFGTINTIFSIMMIVAVPGTTITMIIARELAILDEGKRYFEEYIYVKKYTYKITILGVFVLVIGLIISKYIGNILKINETHTLIEMIIICSLGYFHPLYSGCFSGLKKFFLLGLYGLIIPIYKFMGLFIALILKSESSRLNICLLSIIVGSLVSALLGFVGVRKNIKFNGEEKDFDLLTDKVQWIRVLIINICLTIYINIDLLAVRYICGEKESGYYSAIALFGKFIYYGATSVGTVLLPTVAVKSSDESKKIIKKILIFVSGISIGCLFILNVLKRLCIKIIYGNEYIVAEKYVIYVSMISFSVGIMTVLINYLIGVHDTKAICYVLCMAVISVLIVVMCVDKIKDVLFIIGTVGIIADILLIIKILGVNFRNKILFV